MATKQNSEFITSLMKTVSETVEFVENEPSGLSGIHKLSRAIELISSLLVSTGIIKMFPEYAIRIIKILPKIINSVVDVFNNLPF